RRGRDGSCPVCPAAGTATGCQATRPTVAAAGRFPAAAAGRGPDAAGVCPQAGHDGLRRLPGLRFAGRVAVLRRIHARPPPPEGRVHNIGFDLASGLRIGVGYRAAGSPWETWLTYTYLHAAGDALAVAPAGGLIYPTLTRPGLVDTALVATAGENLTYNVYDV